MGARLLFELMLIDKLFNKIILNSNFSKMIYFLQLVNPLLPSWYNFKKSFYISCVCISQRRFIHSIHFRYFGYFGVTVKNPEKKGEFIEIGEQPSEDDRDILFEEAIEEIEFLLNEIDFSSFITKFGRTRREALPHCPDVKKRLEKRKNVVFLKCLPLPSE